MTMHKDKLLNLIDALVEDIFNTPDNEILREVEEDCGDQYVLAKEFDRILERAIKEAKK